jgi:hypothetical protein
MYALSDEEMRRVSVIPPHIWSGRVLNDGYMIGALVERGAVAELYDGTEISTGERVAIKILLPHLAADAKVRSQFLDEARTLTRSSQPDLLRYRTCAHDPKSGLTYIVTAALALRSARPVRAARPASTASLAAVKAADRFGSRRTVGASVALVLLAAAGFWMSQTLSPSAPRDARAAPAAKPEGAVYATDSSSVAAVQQSAVFAATAKNSTPVPAQPEALNRTEPVDVAVQAEATNATVGQTDALAAADQAVTTVEAAVPSTGLQEAAKESPNATRTADRTIVEKEPLSPPAASQQVTAQQTTLIDDHGTAAPADPPKAAREAAELAATKSAELEKTANRRGSRGLFSRLLGSGGDPAAAAKELDAPPMSAKSSAPSGESETTTNRRGLRGLFNRVLGRGDDKAVPANEVAIDKADQGVAASGRPSAR